MQFHPQFLFTTQFINMSTHEVSVEDVPQRNEAVEEPPAKTSKIVEEALKNFKYGYHKIRKIVLRKH